LKIRPHRPVFGVSGIQRIDFSKKWADGLSDLLDQLEKQGTPKASNGKIQTQWEQYRRRKQIVVERTPEPLTSNWLRIVSAPDELFYVEPIGPDIRSTRLKLGTSFEFPLRDHNRGFLTFANPIEMEEHFLPVGRFGIKHTFDLGKFIESGSEEPDIHPRDAKNFVTDLLRQAW